MSEKCQETIKVMKLALKFIEDLDDATLIAWPEGKKKLVLEDKKTSKSGKSVSIDIHSYIETLEQMKSRDEARAYLMESKLTKSLLQKLAKASGSTISTKDTRERMIESLVNQLVGARLAFEALNNKE